MNIIDVAYKWNGTMEKRNTPISCIVVHHTASTTASPEDVHRWHQEKGWCGIGYNFLIRKDGNVYKGRPLEYIPAHVQGHNEYTIGVAFEGNFEVEQQPQKQIQAGIELIRYLLTLYPQANIKKHKDFGGSTCPGKNFNDVIITEGVKKMETKHWCDEIFKQLKEKGLNINEQRFDDKITRAEVFALLLQTLNIKK
jgi:N-acetylmuramoyl-L-alanine amidase